MKWTAVVLAAVLLSSCACFADEVSDAIAKAQSAYAGRDYPEASTQLQTALAGVNQKLIGLLIAAMPEPPSGWTADDPEGLDSGALGMGFVAGLVVNRTYHSPSGSSIDFEIAANSPMLMTLRMLMSNPMLTQMGNQTGMKKVTACGFDALEQFEDESSMYILAGDATLISLTGDGPEDADHIRSLAAATDCAGIVGIVEH